ncbi:DedA family protein [Sphingobium sp. H39-3-25]|uniref:DedA family protein n=1 Tax=Sphingobium arseniciresistens TaxID=3030834 RepID=UPI0023B90CD2|nr:DedA family protein [Sphingobium arseniciresistens]
MTDWVLHLIDAGGYWGIALLMVLENVFPPIPSELIMGIGGIRVGQGRMEMLPLLLAGTIGTTIGNYFWYLVGARLGIARLKPLVDRYGRWATMEWRDVEALDNIFLRYGQAVVFVFRFMPAFRTMISLPAGLFRMGHVRFVACTFLGATIWNIVLAYSGYLLGANFKEIDKYVGPAATAAVVLAILFYLYRLLTWRPVGDDAVKVTEK